MPHDQDLWSAASKRSGRLEQTQDEAINALREAIVLKCERTSPGERKRTIVALDGVHAGTLEQCIPDYLARYGDPAQEFGVASVWFVGPNELLVKRIGGGAP